MELKTTGRDRNSDSRIGISAVIQLETEEEGSKRQEQTTQAAHNVLKSLSPLINSMRLFGLYFSREPQVAPAMQLGQEAVGRCHGWNPARIYATIILIVTWINACRYCVIFVSIDTLGVELLMKLGLMSNVLLIALLFTAYYVASHTGSLDRVFLQVNLSSADISPKYSRRAKVMTVICWTLLTFSMSLYAVPIFSSGKDDDETLFLFINTFHMSKPVAYVVIAVFILLELQCSASWVFPQAMNYIVVSLLCDQFDKLNKEFSECIGDRGEFHGNFEQFRRRHQTISHSVKEADRFLMISNVACFCCHMLGIIVVLFCSIFYQQDTLSYSSEWAFRCFLYLVINLISLLLAAGLAIFVNNMVTIYNYDVLCSCRPMPKDDTKDSRIV